MGTQTKIEWADRTASPWHGCSHAVMPDGTEHPGCANCYAEAMAKRNPKTLGEWGQDGTRVVSKSFVDNCRKWNREAEKAGVRLSVFPSLCDPFESTDAVVIGRGGLPVLPEGELQRSTLDDLRRELFAVIDSCPWLDFMLLTKRPQNILKMWPERKDVEYVAEAGRMNDFALNRRENVYLIASVSDQDSADEMIPELLKCSDLVPVIGLSVEPLLGPIELMLDGDCGEWQCENCGSRDVDTEVVVADDDVGTYSCESCGYIGAGEDAKWTSLIGWIIAGGESGPSARPCNIDWIRAIVEQCSEAAVPCFVKQLGANVVASDELDPLDQFPGTPKFDGIDRTTIRVHLNDRKGGDWSEWPTDLRVREMPR